MIGKKITILYIAADSTMGGSTASLYNLIDSVREHVEPIVLFPCNGVGVDFFRHHDIECHVCQFNELYMLPYNNLKRVWKHPWRWQYFKRLRYDLSCIIRMSIMLRHKGIQIVHTNNSSTDIGIALAKLLHAKHIWHIRECLDIHRGDAPFMGMQRMIKKVNHADARIAISSFVANHWQLCDYNTYVINDAVFSAEEIPVILPKEKYIMFTAYYLTEPKGTTSVVLAYAKSGIANMGYRLKLVGNCADDYRQTLLSICEQYGIINSVDFIPCQSDIKPYFMKASAFVMFSKNEGLGRTTAEAMFCGCPVVALASGGTLDLVRDGETGYLFNAMDECVRLLQEVCLKNQDKLIIRAQEYVANHLSQEVYGAKIMEIYRKVLRNE